MKNYKKLLSFIGIVSLPIATTVTISSCHRGGDPKKPDTGPKVIDESKFTWDETGETPVLTKIDFSDTTRDTLLLPAKHNDKIYKIKENAFLADDGLTSLIPANIIRLKFKDITAVTITAKAFYNAPFSIIDLSEQEKNYYKDVTKIEFGENSFAFASALAMGEGKIEYNDAFTDGVKNDLQNKLWQAGLKSPSWFAFTEVKTEQELRNASWVGGNIYLSADIELTSPIEFTSNTTLLDLYGHKITSNSTFKDEDGKVTGLIRVYNANLMVYDSTDSTGAIIPYKTDNIADGSYAFHCLNSGTARSSSALTIYGGTYYGNKSVIYNETGTVYIKSIYSGETEKFVPKFHLLKESKTAELPDYGYWMLDCVDENIAAGLASIEISAGEFYFIKPGSTTPSTNFRYDPAGAQADQINGKNADWVKSGYKAIEIKGQMYKVVKE